MTHAVKILLLALALTLLNTVWAISSQSIAINTQLFNSDDILSSDYSSLCVDGEGALWIGTQAGLIRFDGTNSDKYLYDESNPGSLSDNRVIKILCDTEGRVWIATCEGLNLYNRGTDDFTRIRLPYIEFNGYISDIYQQSNGEIAFIAAGIGIYIINPDSEEPAPRCIMKLTPGHSDFNTLCETPSGELIGGTHKGEIVKLQSKNGTGTMKVSDSYIKTLIKDDCGNIFVTTTKQAWLQDGKTGKLREVTIPARKGIIINCTTKTRSGDILAGTNGNGIFRLPKGSLEMQPDDRFSNPGSDISQSNISAIHEDPSLNLWAGSNRQGVMMARHEEMPYNFINLEKYAASHYINRIKIAINDRDGNIWAGADDGQLLKLDENGTLLQKFQFSNPISSIRCSKNGKIYIGVDNQGLYEANNGGRISQLLKMDGTYIAAAITEDSSGNIYFGIHGSGVARINPATKETRWLKNEESEFNPVWISSLFCDSKDRIWIGMYGALSIYDTGKDEFIYLSSTYPQMCKGVHNDIAEDRKGRIWSVTSNGLFIINPEDCSFRRLALNDGLSNIFLSTITFDSAGNAWIGSRSGIDRIDTAMTVIKHNPNKNLKELEYSSAIESNNRIFLSGSRGIISFNPEILSTYTTKPGIFISAIYLNGEKITQESRAVSNGKKIVDDSGTIHLSYSDSHLSIRTALRDFQENDHIVYQWRIPDMNDDWIPTSPGNHLIALPHLDAGKHRIEIKGVSNGIESDIIELTAIVSPPWYLTTGAKTAYLLLILIIPTLAALFIREKNAEKINNEKIKFFINVSHELRSPLTLILSPLEKIMKSEHDPETARNLHAIHRNANRILNLINQLLYIRKLDKGKMELSYSTVDFNAFVSEIAELFQPQAQEKNISLTFTPDETHQEMTRVNLDADNFDKVIANLLSNAIKFTPAGGEIDIATRSGQSRSMGRFVELTVSDTGPGLDEKSVKHIFDRFYQGKNTKSQGAGFGIGLNLSQMLVKLHHGTISAKNRTDRRGSRFTVRIPVNRGSVTGSKTESSSAQSAFSTADTMSPQQQRLPKPTRNKSLYILIIDDDAELCAYLAENLSAFGCTATAGNGQEGLKMITEKHPDIIISDVAMPVMDGISLLKAIKSNSSTSHIPVIMLSSKNDVPARLSGWEKGADCYLGKPFSIDELQSIIDNIIDNRLRLRGKFSGTQNQEERFTQSDIKGNDDTLIDRIADIIERNLGDSSFNVEKLCLEAGMSRAHLNRKMKELFGLNPSDFIRNARLHRACELLKNTDIDISQIAYGTGFTTQAHFSNAFKRFTGSSPSEYRESANKKNQAEE